MARRHQKSFSHEALLYSDAQGFVATVEPLILSALDVGSPVMVAVPEVSLSLLQDHLGPRGDEVEMVPMDDVGRNPGRVIDLLATFVENRSAATSAPLGICELIWPERSAHEVVECLVHEDLVNHAFLDHHGFRLVCVYDTSTLPMALVQDAMSAHPDGYHGGAAHPCEAPRPARVADILDRPLVAPPSGAETHKIELDSLPSIRESVAATARLHNVAPRSRIEDLVLAVSELCANSVIHAEGEGTLTVWADADSLWCNVSDGGRIHDPLVGRRRPSQHQLGGRGVWIAHQVCDLVQVRSNALGTTVRLRMDRTLGHHDIGPNRGDT